MNRKPTVNRNAFMVVCALALACLVGCAFFQKATPAIPAVVALGECITSKAIAGESYASIATECKTDLLTVLDTLISSELPAVKASRAYVEAHEMVVGVVRAYRSHQAQQGTTL
jgi:hypothetical protein